MDKRTQRKKVLSLLQEMTATEYKQKSAIIVDRLLEDPAFLAAQTIGITISAFPEVATWDLIEKCWGRGKRVVVPKCHRVSRTLDFHAIEHKNQLEVVYMNLQEPIVSKTLYIEPKDIDLLIVPGVVFSKEGFRIGFGGGYYDRFLASFSGATRSLAFDCQVAESIPVEPHDLPVQRIFTESKIITPKAVDR
ncbi:5-formyltetrahydrofolate cyclo-ligase [Planococcus faecalis]|uniref:5-formyltetrahydrofolate cyclo-ligase n=1 Tax=Planococcus faecalis TaxID=1598147 RepID=A0ABN4XK56_9BACL|nr:5-formyltetrahydrofolate cyclo-ligase [Planococcus faecalis]AQU79176.1 5-formyltetrahydrofolate cyclo-ligase [Planococcus faecalis]OHX51813.1 5-formyltetrahydrofolate cyclo-ligase [Planococcus faecalis]